MGESDWDLGFFSIWELTLGSSKEFSSAEDGFLLDSFKDWLGNRLTEIYFSAFSTVLSITKILTVVSLGGFFFY